MPPLVSALMVTQPGREKFVEEATEAFHAQSYVNKELVIVHENKCYACGHERHPAPILGELRNEAIRRAAGDIIIQWDDDDLYAPNRITEQVEAIHSQWPVSMSMLYQLTLQCVCGFQAPSEERPWENTVAMLRGVANTLPYRPMSSGEDTAFVSDALAKGLMLKVVRNGPGLYVYRMHGTNTCSPEHWNRLFQMSPDPEANRHYPSKCLENLRAK